MLLLLPRSPWRCNIGLSPAFAVAKPIKPPEKSGPYRRFLHGPLCALSAEAVRQIRTLDLGRTPSSQSPSPVCTHVNCCSVRLPFGTCLGLFAGSRQTWEQSAPVWRIVRSFIYECLSIVEFVFLPRLPNITLSAATTSQHHSYLGVHTSL